MMMKMRLYVPTAMAVMMSVLVTTTAFIPTTTWPRTTVSPGLNLKGKMFTLSRYGGGISLYPPSFSPSPSPSSYSWTSPPSSSSSSWNPTTTPYRTSYPSWTTASPSRGVSVCLRYVAEETDQPIFTLSPYSPSQLALTGKPIGRYQLSFFNGGYRSLSFSSYRMFWSWVRPDFWSRVCVTVDTMKGVAQTFSGGAMSIRKKLPVEYVWTGEPVIDISGFEGQVTDVQVWNYPLLYRDVVNYMTYGSYRGSVITWSQISYSLRGNSLLEDAYEWQENRPVRRGNREKGPMGEKRKRFSNKGRGKERKRERL